MNLKGVVAGSAHALFDDLTAFDTFSVPPEQSSQSVSEIIMPSFSSALVQAILGSCHDLLPPKKSKSDSADELVGLC
jgi:hypothetical protein